MRTTIFDGNKYALKKQELLKDKVKLLRSKNITPQLATILVGDNKASTLYVNLKKRAGKKIGVEVSIYKMNPNTNEILQLIESLNQDDTIHGILLQLPLPKIIKKDTQKITKKISLQKDVDGLRKKSKYTPATVSAILQILNFAKANKNALTLIVGSSGMVGKPLIRILKNKNYNLITADIHTKNITNLAKKADVIISATGKPKIISEVKKGSIIIDVGSPKGDVDFDKVKSTAKFVTPVPGGVGPVTIISLFENLLQTFAKK